MAAAKVRIFCLENAILFRGLKIISRIRLSNHSLPPINNSTRSISAKSFLAKDQVDSESTNNKQNEDEKRTDLKRLKELLFQKDSKAMDIQDVAKAVKPRIKKKKSTISKDRAAVNLAQLTDMLSILKQSDDQSLDLHNKSNTTVDEKVLQPSESAPMTSTVEADKFKDALSSLEQDSSTPDEVIMAGQQISSDTRSAIEGAYTIKQRQLQEKDKRKKMTRSSLKIGPRFHMFDGVKEKWSNEQDKENLSLFQEMDEQNVRELGMASTVQSGFHDLVDNVHRQWSFPIDNEICKTDEDDVGFDEHVFLEHLLHDFPKAGNIQQFMELVVTGLQQNPHLSVQDKREHIEWFKEYFENMPDDHVEL